MFFSILITYLLNVVLILQGEIHSWSLMGVKGLKAKLLNNSESDEEKGAPSLQ